MLIQVTLITNTTVAQRVTLWISIILAGRHCWGMEGVASPEIIQKNASNCRSCWRAQATFLKKMRGILIFG